MAEEANSLEYTPTWVVAVVCFVIVLMSLLAERALHKLGKLLQKKKQEALFQALQKLKEELMLLGFISLLLTVTQNAISRICIPPHLANVMLPCKKEIESSNQEEHYQHNKRHLLSASKNAALCVHGVSNALSEDSCQYHSITSPFKFDDYGNSYFSNS